MKLSLLCSFSVLALAANVHAAAFTTNFNSFNSRSSPAGQGGWTINDPDPDMALWTTMDVLSPALGGASDVFVPSVSTVGLTHAYGDPFVNAGNMGTSINFDFMIMDSVDLFPKRDIFGIALTNAGGNLFTLVFTPWSSANPDGQSPTPESDVVQWNLSYSEDPAYIPGVSTTVSLTEGVTEESQFSVDLRFTPHDAVSTDFTLDLGWGPAWIRTGTLAIAPGTVIDDFSLTWTPTFGIADAGSNFFIIDNLAVVPEPSAAALLGLAGLGLAFRRRRA
jgi:hypothetical protein